MTAFDGHCACRHVRYRMTSGPLFVHCCHCDWCQRETGSAFALNALKSSEVWPKESLERRAKVLPPR